MSKYKIIKLWGLKELLRFNHEEIYSPDGYSLIAVRNGILGGQLLYDYKNKKVYGLCLKELTDVDEEYINQCNGQYALEKANREMNYKEAIEFLKNKGKWIE